MNVIQVKMMLFAKARDLVGSSEAKIELENHQRVSLGRSLLDLIVEKFPRLEPLRNNLAVAINEAYIDLDEMVSLNDGDEIALIPPISGG